MEFRQPNELDRIMHQVLSNLLYGHRVTLSFATESEMDHALEVLNEVAISRNLSVVVTAHGRRNVILSLAATAA